MAKAPLRGIIGLLGTLGTACRALTITPHRTTNHHLPDRVLVTFAIGGFRHRLVSACDIGDLEHARGITTRKGLDRR